MRRTPHYIPPLKKTVLPETHIVIDTEARVVPRAGAYVHRWVCGAGLRITGSDLHPYRTDDIELRWDDPSKMWADIVALPHRPDVVWAHNLAYDLRISQALEWLPQLGYSIDAISITRTSTWAGFTHADGHKLGLCDLWSWCPVPLDTLANDQQVTRPPLDYDTASDDDLADRCMFDAGVTAGAVCRILNWLKANDGGSFRPTGSGQCHAWWRRKHLPAKEILVHCDDNALIRERTAMHTGRTEVWRHGEVIGPIQEVDMNLAYCRIAASHALPGKLTYRRGKTTITEYRELLSKYCVLADVTVDTGVECVPVTEHDRVYWPIGCFKTTLWDPEIDLALECGADVQIERLWTYSRTFSLKAPSRDIIDMLEGGRGAAHPVVQRMLKHWSRALTGRCALRYRSWEDWAQAPDMRLALTHFADPDGGNVEQHLQVGQRVMMLADIAESTSSVPQITGWVASRCRADLWRLMRMFPSGSVLYCDTDGLLVKGSRKLVQDYLSTHNNYTRPRIKATYQSAVLHGPRNIVVGTERKISGIPKRAIETADLEFDGLIWSGLASDIEGKHGSTVRQFPKQWVMRPRDNRRIHLPDGTTVPHERTRDDS